MTTTTRPISPGKVIGTIPGQPQVQRIPAQRPTTPPRVQYTQQVNHVSQGDVVPRWQYDKAVNECKNWETKYN